MKSELIGESGRPHMLIVDDEEGLRKALNAVFYRDFEMHLCRNSAEALEVVAKNRISVAILDIRMQGESGLDLLKQIKANDPSVEVIMLTAYETLEAAKLAVRRQACDFLAKPFDIGVISRSVAKALRLRMASEVAERAISGMNGGPSAAVSAQDGVLHDVRNVMTSVMGMSEDCADMVSRSETLGPAAVRELRQALGTLVQHTELACKMCGRSLKVLARSGSKDGSRDIHPQLQVVCDVLANHPDGKGSLVSYLSEPGKRFCIEGEPSDVYRMVLNLGLNGLKSTTRRQHLTIEAREVKEPLSLNMLQDTSTTKVFKSPLFTNRAPFVAVAIRDTGDGIQPQILEQFGKTLVTTKSDGHGIGTFVVADLISANAALLFIETTLGKGTTTTIYLPKAPD